MPSGLGEAPGGWGSDRGGWGGDDADRTNFGSYTEDDGAGGYNTVNVSDYGMDPADSGFGFNPDYGISSNNIGDWWSGSSPVNSSYNFFDAGPQYSSLADSFAAPSFSSPAWSGITDISMPNSSAEQAPEASFMDSEFARGLRRAGLFAARQNPAASTALGVAGAAQAIGQGQYGPMAGLALGAATKNPLIGGLGTLFGDAISDPTRSYTEEGGGVVSVNDRGLAPTLGQRIGQFGARAIASTLGGAVAGPFGAMLGNDLANYATSRGVTGPAATRDPNRGDAQSNRPQTDGTGRPGDLFGALGGGLVDLYGLNRARGTSKREQAAQEANKAQLDALMAQINSREGMPQMPGEPALREPNFGAVHSRLDQMFGPTSGVAGEMRKQLERKDSAAGRRSQYGPREVQLMAELTRLRAQAEPNYLGAEVSAANAANQGALGAYQGAVNMYNSQMGERQQNLQRLLAAQQLNQNNTANSFKAQEASDQRRMQQLATLYGMGKESGFNNWAGNTISGWFE